MRALILEQSDAGISSQVDEVDDARLPDGDVTVQVEYSTLNYKDGMILNGLGRLVRAYPHVPGVDFAGVVAQSANPAFKPGDRVVLTGWRVGEVRWGGYSTRARVPGEWLVKLPEALSTRRAMAIGTAGFTAMLAVMALEDHGVSLDKGEVLVTGAAGGVGSIATAILTRSGYTVAASTGRPETHDYLRALGASTLIDRAELATPAGRPLEAERWQAAIDSVAGPTLARVLGQVHYRGAVASVGLAAGDKVDLSVIPLLLRGVSLLGVDSVMCPIDRRVAAWDRLASVFPDDTLLSAIAPRDVRLEDLPLLGKAILNGQVRGRVVVDVNL